MTGITDPSEEYFKDGLWAWVTSAWKKVLATAEGYLGIAGRKSDGTPAGILVDSDGTVHVTGSLTAFPHPLLDGSVHNDTIGGAPVKGDIIVGIDIGGGVIRWKWLAKGTTGQVLTVQADGTVAWAAGAGMLSRARAYLDVAVQSIPTSTWTKITLNAEDYDNLAEFDPVTNYRFTASVAGYYLCAGAVNLQTPVDQQWAIVDIRKNNVATGQITAAASGTLNISPEVTNVLYLAAGDYVELWFYHTAGVAKNAGYSSAATWLCVHRLS